MSRLFTLDALITMAVLAVIVSPFVAIGYLIDPSSKAASLMALGLIGFWLGRFGG